MIPSSCPVCQAPTHPQIITADFVAITAAAFADSINPCAIAVLLILLATILAAGERSKALKSGLAFVLALYLAYFLLGLGLLSFLQLANLAGIFHKIIGSLAILIGIFNIKDFFWYGGGGFVMEIPRSWRPTLKKLLKRATSPPVAFLIGLVVTLFELPCTGGPYIFALGLLSNNYSWSTIIPILLYYNLIFILPLIAIILLIYFGLSTTQKADAWKEKNIRILHLITGIIMIALGVWVFLH